MAAPPLVTMWTISADPLFDYIPQKSPDSDLPGGRHGGCHRDEENQQRQTRPQTQHRDDAASLLRPDRQEGYGAAVEGHEVGCHQGAGDPRLPARLAL